MLRELTDVDECELDRVGVGADALDDLAVLEPADVVALDFDDVAALADADLVRVRLWVDVVDADGTVAFDGDAEAPLLGRFLEHA